jgi:hypothetical protein
MTLFAATRPPQPVVALVMMIVGFVIFVINDFADRRDPDRC